MPIDVRPSPLPPEAGPATRTGVDALRPMSTTAGVGSGEYRSVNPLAVAAAVLGVASLAAVLSPVLLVLPLAGVVCGAVAWWQVRTSGGTQTGTLPALAGLLVSLVVGLVVAGDAVSTGLSDRSHRREVTAFLQAMGDDLVAGEYAAAYARTGPQFQNEVDLPRFAGFFEALQAQRDAAGNPLLGRLTRAGTNPHAIVYRDPTTGTIFADAMLILEFEAADQPLREPTLVVRSPEGWVLRRFSTWFPSEG